MSRFVIPGWANEFAITTRCKLSRNPGRHLQM